MGKSKKELAQEENKKNLKPVKPRGLVRTCYIKRYDALTYDLMCVEVENKQVVKEYSIGNPELIGVIERRARKFIFDHMKEAELYDRQRKGIKLEIDRENKFEAEPEDLYTY